MPAWVEPCGCFLWNTKNGFLQSQTKQSRHASHTTCVVHSLILKWGLLHTTSHAPSWKTSCQARHHDLLQTSPWVDPCCVFLLGTLASSLHFLRGSSEANDMCLSHTAWPLHYYNKSILYVKLSHILGMLPPRACSVQLQNRSYP